MSDDVTIQQFLRIQPLKGFKNFYKNSINTKNERMSCLYQPWNTFIFYDMLSESGGQTHYNSQRDFIKK